MIEVMLEEENRALSCSLSLRFFEDIFIELNKLFILGCNFDVLIHVRNQHRASHMSVM